MSEIFEPYVRPEFRDLSGYAGHNHGQPQRPQQVDGAQLTYNQMVEEALQALAHGEITRAQYVSSIGVYRELTGKTVSDCTIV